MPVLPGTREQILGMNRLLFGMLLIVAGCAAQSVR